MPGYPQTNLVNYFDAKKALSDTGILPPENINFEVITVNDVTKTFKTFDKSIHSGIYVTLDKSIMP
jgi:hypothetical protein